MVTTKTWGNFFLLPTSKHHCVALICPFLKRLSSKHIILFISFQNSILSKQTFDCWLIVVEIAHLPKLWLVSLSLPKIDISIELSPVAWCWMLQSRLCNKIRVYWSFKSYISIFSWNVGEKEKSSFDFYEISSLLVSDFNFDWIFEVFFILFWTMPNTRREMVYLFKKKCISKFLELISHFEFGLWLIQTKFYNSTSICELELQS